MCVKESHKCDDGGDDVGDFFYGNGDMHREFDCMYITGAGSNDSWQGHRLRRGDGRTSSEQVRQLTEVNKKN